MTIHCFNPDAYLETPNGRVYTPELNAAAWDSALSDLRVHLVHTPVSNLYVVIGIQAAGKTTWINTNAQKLGERACFFDAALPKAVHRRRVLDVAASCEIPAVAVWVKASLAAALARNHQRRPDHRVPEQAIRSVFASFEPPTLREGFVQVVQVASGEARE